MCPLTSNWSHFNFKKGKVLKSNLLRYYDHQSVYRLTALSCHYTVVMMLLLNLVEKTKQNQNSCD